MNARAQDVYLNQLEAWAENGLIIVERAPAMLQELDGERRREKASSMPGHPNLFTLGVSLGGGDVLAGPSIPREDLKGILFPTADELTTNQEADIRHLQEVARTGSDCFVTLNTRDFVDGGKKERLAKEFGIWVFTPGEMVRLLATLYGF